MVAKLVTAVSFKTPSFHCQSPLRAFQTGDGCWKVSCRIGAGGAAGCPEALAAAAAASAWAAAVSAVAAVTAACSRLGTAFIHEPFRSLQHVLGNLGPQMGIPGLDRQADGSDFNGAAEHRGDSGCDGSSFVGVAVITAFKEECGDFGFAVENASDACFEHRSEGGVFFGVKITGEWVGADIMRFKEGAKR
jgi:hypothetical protein